MFWIELPLKTVIHFGNSATGHPASLKLTKQHFTKLKTTLQGFRAILPA